MNRRSSGNKNKQRCGRGMKSGRLTEDMGRLTWLKLKFILTGHGDMNTINK